MIKIERIIKRLNTIAGMISGVAIICLSSVIFFEVISRKVFKSPTLWTFDVSSYLFLLISFLAFTFAMQEDGHIGFNYFVERVKYKKVWAKVLTIFSGIAGASFCVLFFYENFRQTIMAFKLNWMTRGMTEIPAYYLYTLMCIGGLMLLITFLMKTIMNLFNIKESGNSSQNN
jgi:TRAP-type C4-dicarboxylate transport system permease small subunit